MIGRLSMILFFMKWKKEIEYINLYGIDIQHDFDRLNPLNNALNKAHHHTSADINLHLFT